MKKERLRDEFAIAALPVIITHSLEYDVAVKKKDWAEFAYVWADAMMEARKQ